MITSAANPKVKYMRRLQTDSRFRQQEGMMVVEGDRWLDDLLMQHQTPALIVCTPTWLEKHPGRELPMTPWVVNESVMASMSNLTTPPGVMAATPMPNLPLPTQPTWLLILDRLSTPGNLGTVLRTAAAAGVEGLILTPGSIDPYNPKVLRGSMGAHLRLPLRQLNWQEIADLVRPLRVWVAVAAGRTPYTSVDWTTPTALIIGSEAQGPGPQALALAHGSTAIPMAAATESLNAAMAAAIILFEAARQRQAQTTTRTA